MSPSRPHHLALLAGLGWLVAGLAIAADEPPTEPAAPTPATSAEVLAASQPGDWRPLDPERTLYVDLPGGRVVIELAPEFAPHHVANVLTLTRQGYYDGLPILRSQENYVVQWGDPEEDPEKGRSIGEARRTIAAELWRGAEGLAFTPLADGDVYAAEVGFVGGFPVGRDPATGRAWLVHCNGMVGAGRGNEADSGNGTHLYVVIGHAPRHLDRNVTLLGRVVQGMEHLSTLPRGTGALGFYEDPAQQVPLTAARLAADLPAAERLPIEVLRTDTPTFAAYVDARRHRREEWFLDPVGRVELCNVPILVRPAPAPGSDTGDDAASGR